MRKKMKKLISKLNAGQRPSELWGQRKGGHSDWPNQEVKREKIELWADGLINNNMHLGFPNQIEIDNEQFWGTCYWQLD